MSEEISFRDTLPEDTPALIRFAGESLGSAWDEDFIHWKYFANPAGRFYGRVAEAGGRPFGFYGNIPVRLKLGTQITTGAQAVDAMIAPEARRLGLFVKLNQQTYTEMDRDSIAIDYALPNPVSEAGFIKRLGWQPVGPIPRYIKILDYRKLPNSIRHDGLKGLIFRSYLTAVRIKNKTLRASANRQLQHTYHKTQTTSPIQTRIVSSFDERSNDLWRQVASAIPIAVQRDQVYLNWRYVENPQKIYRIIYAERGADLAGMAVISLRDLDTHRSAAIVEWLVRPEDYEAGRALLAKIETEAIIAGCAQIQCWMLPAFSFYTQLLRYSGYSFSTGRSAPNYLGYTTPFIIRRHPHIAFDVDPVSIANWYLTMGDHDYY